MDKTIKQGSLDEVTFACKLSHKGKKAKWYLRNQVRMYFCLFCFSKSVPLCRSNLFTRGCNSVNSGVLREFHLYYLAHVIKTTKFTNSESPIFCLLA